MKKTQWHRHGSPERPNDQTKPLPPPNPTHQPTNHRRVLPGISFIFRVMDGPTWATWRHWPKDHRLLPGWGPGRIFFFGHFFIFFPQLRTRIGPTHFLHWNKPTNQKRKKKQNKNNSTFRDRTSRADRADSIRSLVTEDVSIVAILRFFFHRPPYREDKKKYVRRRSRTTNKLFRAFRSNSFTMKTSALRWNKKKIENESRANGLVDFRNGIRDADKRRRTSFLRKKKSAKKNEAQPRAEEEKEEEEAGGKRERERKRGKPKKN